MCTSKPKAAPTPAAAPAPPIEPADAPEVGEARRRQNQDLFGQENPNYRVKRVSTQGSMNPNNPITM